MCRSRRNAEAICRREPGHATTEAEVRLSPVLPEEEVGGVHGAVVAVSVVVPRSRGGGGGPAVVFAPPPSSIDRMSGLDGGGGVSPREDGVHLNEIRERRPSVAAFVVG